LTLPISAGVVAPMMVVGGLVGRIYGMLMPEWFVNFLLSAPGQPYSAITDDERGALIARFAIVGAAAHATAVTRAFAMAITVYEVLTLPSTLLPLCSSCLAAIFVANKIALPFFDMNLTGRGLGGITALTQDRANKSVTCIMKHLDGGDDCLHEHSSVHEIRCILDATDKDTHHYAILQNVACGFAPEGHHNCASLLKGCITRESLELVLDRAGNKSAKYEIHLLAADLTTPQAVDTEPLICLNPQHVTPDSMVKDVYIIMKASEAEAVYVIENNCLLGVITWEQVLGHKLTKPWFG